MRSLARAFSSSRRAPEQGVVAEFRDGVQERGDLHAVARFVLAGALDDAPGAQGVLHRPDKKCLSRKLGRPLVPEVDHLREAVAGVHVQQREREAPRAEGLLGEAQHHDAVLAAGEQEGGPFEGSGHLAEDVDAFGLEVFALGHLPDALLLP